MEKHPLSEVMGITMEKIKEMVDVNTVVGDPITTEDGVVVIPISKVSLGFGTGGSDFNGKKEGAKNNFGGGGGAGISISPVAFLVVEATGVKLIPVTTNPEPVDKIAAMLPDLFDKVTGFIAKMKDKKKEEKQTAEKEGIEE